MKKTKANLGNEKKKKVPFNVFSKKGLAALALAGVMVASPFMLAGCSGEKGPKGDPGAPGANGPQWHYSTVDVVNGTLSGDVDFTAVNGDFYIDTDSYILYQLKNGSWAKVMENYGRPGSTGETGPQGPQGETGPQGPAGENGQDGQNGTNGINGQNGATWLTGTAITGTGTGISATIEDSKVGDLYFNTNTCDIYQCSAENTWNWIANIKGATGETGPQGPQGEDGTSVYVGYDGYIWKGTERTDFKLENSIVDETLAENTIGLYGNKYFTQNLVSTSKPIALMGNYFPTIKKTGYSGITVDEISVYAETAGTLEIGTASVENIVNARTNGTSLATNTTAYTLKAGLNTIKLELEVADTDTIVLGGGTSNVSLYSYEEVNGEDEYGFYTICDEQARAELFEETSNVKDKLIIKVNISKVVIEEVECIEGLEAEFNNVTSNGTNYNVFSLTQCPGVTYINDSAAAFEGKTITRIKAPLQSITAIDDQQYFTVFVIDIGENPEYTTTHSVVSTYKVYIPVEQLEGHDINNFNDVIDVDVSSLNITVAENQTLAFGVRNVEGVTSDPVSFKSYNSPSVSISSSAVNQVEGYVDGFGPGSHPNVRSYYMCYHKPSIHLTFAEHLENLKNENAKNISNQILQGKQMSVLGDSISTYAGYSNNSQDNSTLSSNAVYDQPYLSSVNDTWWEQVISEYDMELCVNNSHSGGYVSNHAGNVAGDASTSAMNRGTQLHDDVTEDNTNQEVVNPDLIAIYMGINDYINVTDIPAGSFEDINWDTLITEVSTGNFTYAIPTTFAEAYAIMLHKITTIYPNADVVTMTLPGTTWCSSDTDGSRLSQFNDIINKLANKYGCIVVDLTQAGIDLETDLGDGLHPNSSGMNKIAECFIQTLNDIYLTQE